ncbi:MAG: hypothetical protein A2782_00990 [Candidatus Blackburnbacteria bacterium RIFCSPHIGHO2_01_FULL_43_15b]|uniref:DUF2007 domain-containing protein n=1 Tax=Candidatus Blackburnbacteria bacterium RIFCSPHIGHO2_01_FULL_43_15b TaxID=1797513 RepID=A0A1G1V0Y1_9BACT|nr:MAG: hypothetical protein A2782_00990 [Candidatus Blackburnbacteria bacterium RIFCSPHIGHO2_01_FULL_43_15b]
MTELVAVTSYPARLEAEIAKGFLEVNGITAEIEADDAGGVHQFPAYSFGAQIKVSKKDFEKAKKLLADK